MKTLDCGAIVDEDVYDWARHFKWRTTPYGYIVIIQHHHVAYLHKVVMNAEVGQIVDHINRNLLDCRRENLRLATRSENAINTDRYHYNGRSSYRGVTMDMRNEKWRASIQKDGKRTALGYFKTEDEAARAYDTAAKELHGDFAMLNFPEE